MESKASASTVDAQESTQQNRREFIKSAARFALAFASAPHIAAIAQRADNNTLPMDLDVLIIGGGIQGVWILKELRRRGYGAILVEKNALGGAQTCHSHVYIHRGHLYAHPGGDLELAERLKTTEGLWQDILEKRDRALDVLTHFGFQDSHVADEHFKIWDRLGLSYSRVQVPEALKDGSIKTVARSPELAVNGGWLMRMLIAGHEKSAGRISDVNRIILATADGSQQPVVRYVDVVLPNNRTVRFQLRALVLAAGAGNQRLLELAAEGDRDRLARVRSIQHIRKAHMLAIRGQRMSLPALAGILPDFGLFIGSRQKEQDTIWLVSDGRSPHLEEPDDWMRYNEQWWIPQVVQNLHKVVPYAVNNKEDLHWGIYAAPKAEVRTPALEERRDWTTQCGIKNLWAVWPNKLTLAPLAGNEVAASIDMLLQKPRVSVDQWENIRVPVSIASELWEKTPLFSWKEFLDTYSVEFSSLGRSDATDFTTNRLWTSNFRESTLVAS